MMRASHRQPGFAAAVAHRLSGIVLALFLPAHFLALGTALRGADALDSFLIATNNALVKSFEIGLVSALALHLALGLRILAIELMPRRERTFAAVTVCFGISLAVGLVFLLNAT